jgi:intein/homing endonuclease
MAKTFEKAVTGFNHNIKYKGKVYHVQTEDSGVNNPHIITHLFVGGNILASKKTSYADILNAENLSEVVRELMEEQHKEMLRNLINGVYDGFETGVRHYQPGQLGSADDLARHRPPPGPSTFPSASRPPPAEPPASFVPPEVAAARAMKVQPKINEVGVETLFGEDLISEKSLDEVILSYLAGEDNQ